MTRLIDKTITDKVIQKSRIQLIRRAINFIIFVIGLIILMIIWGVKQSELAVFVGSILTIVGVAFFAQWSLLSNITSSIILFFGHSVKVGDSIIIMETKDYEIRGDVVNIGLFFTKIKLAEVEDEITLPNNLFIQKTVRKVLGVKNEVQSEEEIPLEQQ
ncbi:mechanosensitive ion channel domain-containing protein [Gangjinia marincola]